MRTFYLFKLNYTYYNEANNNPDNVYLLFKSIYDYNKSNIEVAYDLFNDIASPLNYEFIDSYILNKLKIDESYTKYRNIHMYYNYLTQEVSKMNIMKSHIKIKSNQYNNIFMNNLKDITDLFVCDFIYDKYELFKNNYYKYK